MEEEKKMGEDEYLWIRAILDCLIGEKKARVKKFRDMDGYTLAGLCVGEITIMKSKHNLLASQFTNILKECDRLRVAGLELDFKEGEKTDAEI